jgi:hypothetical protein
MLVDEAKSTEPACSICALFTRRFLVPGGGLLSFLAAVKYLTRDRFFAVRMSDGQAEMVMFASSGVRSIDGFAFRRESMTQALNSGLPCPTYP